MEGALVGLILSRGRGGFRLLDPLVTLLLRYHGARRDKMLLLIGWQAIHRLVNALIPLMASLDLMPGGD